MTDLAFRNELEWYKNALDRMITENEELEKNQKELMDQGNTFASGRWFQAKETVRQLKWIRRYSS